MAFEKMVTIRSNVNQIHFYSSEFPLFSLHKTIDL